MACLSNYLETQILTHAFRTSSWTKPSALAVALCTTTPTASSTGSTIVEVTNSGTGYTRQSLNPLDANWSLTLSGGNEVISNSVAFTFPVATASYGSNVTSIAICDSATYQSGNVYAFGAVTTAQSVSTGNQITIPIGNLQMYLQ